MTHSQNCNEQLDYWTVYRSFLAGYDSISCPNCGVEYVHRTRNRLLGSGSILVLLLLFYIFGRAVAPSVPILWQSLAFLLACFLVSLALVPLLRFDRREISENP